VSPGQPDVTERVLTEPDGLLAIPGRRCGTGVLVIAGSSGRIDTERVRLLARHGAVALSIRWFGGDGQQPGPCEVPLETFGAALDLLAPHCDRLAVVGLSFGAEAALLTGAHDARVDVVVGFAPSSVVWAGVDPGVGAGAGTGRGGAPPRQASHWTLDGLPLPHVPLVEDWTPRTDPPAHLGHYEQSLAADPPAAAAAAIPVERIGGEVVLVAGEDDQVWPSAHFTRSIVRRRGDHGLATRVITHPHAGHRTILPGEPPVTAGAHLARGGTVEADAELGARAWPVLVEVLRLHGHPT